jgi:hypothetical protein
MEQLILLIIVREMVTVISKNPLFGTLDGWMDGFRRVESSQTPARGPQFGPNVQPWKGG